MTATLDGAAPRDDRAVPSRGGDRGSGTVLLLGVVAVAVTLAAGLGLLVSAQLALGRAQSAADLAALAAADRARDYGLGLTGAGAGGEAGPSGGSGAVGPEAAGDPCGEASAVAARNGARLVACRVEAAGIVRVAVAVPGRAGSTAAEARAGPAGAARG